ncbi:MAG: hypothetical protein MUF31_05275 [Akkermansiaceae bacterium]|jgi:hypothetical protein|nr:hypothetical protein [Akkermansiaceae bacterium]
MDLEHHKLEAELEGLLPQALEADLMERLMGAVGHPAVGREAGLVPVEEQLKRLLPLAPAGPLAGKLIATLERTPFRADDKLLLFPRGSAARPQGSRSRGWMAAAAAVAIAGGISALWLSPEKPIDGPVAQIPPTAGQIAAGPAAASPAGFTPAGFGSEVETTRDLGVRWNGDAQPMRVLKVVYTDRIKFTNDKGETFEAEVPRVQYIVAPEELD